MYMFSSNLLRISHCRCFEIVRPLGRGTLPQSCRLVVPVLSNSCAEVVPRVFICPKPVLKLSQRCPNVVPKLSQSCLQVVSRFPPSCLKVISKDQSPKVIPSLYPSGSNMWTIWEYGAMIILKCSVNIMTRCCKAFPICGQKWEYGAKIIFKCSVKIITRCCKVFPICGQCGSMAQR